MATLRVDGAELFYHAQGSGPPVLLIHGATGSATAYWAPLAAVLAEDMRVVTYDQRGFGRSVEDVPAGRLDVDRLAKDAAALLEYLGLLPAAVVGLSLGGLVAQQLAATRPDAVSRLVLASTAPRMGHRLKLLGSVLGNLAAREDAGALFDLNALLTYSERYLETHTEELAASREAFVRQGTAWFGTALSTAPEWEGVPPGSIECPTLLIYGDEDAEMPLRYARELADTIPHTRLTVLEGAGHKCAEEQPQAFGAAVRAFLRDRPHPR